MVEIGFQEKNKILDDIILNRRTIREFLDDVPSKDIIESIADAGLQAPFAAIAVVGEKYFRKFFILRQGKTLDRLAAILQNKVKILSAELLEKCKEDNFAKLLKDVADQGFKFRSPYVIIVAEKKGFPPVEQLSLAHCLENMWLKATAMGLGFQLLSIVAEMSNDEEFCKIIGIETGKYVLNACAVGYPKTIPAKIERPLLKDVLTWID